MIGSACRRIEIDVLLSADGHVVALHDYVLGRSQTRLYGLWLVARGPALKAMTLTELQRYDVGRSRPGSGEDVRHPGRIAFDGAGIPMLPAILDALKTDPRARRLLYIEIKTGPQNTDLAPDSAADYAETPRSSRSTGRCCGA